MKFVSFFKKALILGGFFLFFSLLPLSIPHIPNSVVVAEASEINDKDDPTDVKLNVKTVSLVKENSYTLRVYNTTDSMNISFKSNDSDVVSVLAGDSNTATVTGINVGTTTVTVTVKEGRKTIATLDCEIVVGPPMISYKFTQDKITLGVDKRKTLGATILPSNSTEVPIFTSSNPAVATVTSSGKVITKAPGTTKITATLSNGKTATCIVIVDASINNDSE